MPFDKIFDDVYKLGIKSACQEAGTYCKRVDEQIFTESILEHIYNQISKADIIVSDMTGKNPNVFYETGYAHAMGKIVILLTQDANDIPFDMKHYPHIIYGSSISTMKDELARRITWCIENPNQKLSSTGYELEFRLWGVNISNRSGQNPPTINIPFDIAIKLDQRTQSTLNFEIFNPGNRSIDLANIQIGVILPIEFEVYSASSIRLFPESRTIMYLLPTIGKIWPTGWLLVPFVLPIGKLGKLLDRSHDCCLRVFTDIGVKNYPYSIRPIIYKSMTQDSSLDTATLD